MACDLTRGRLVACKDSVGGIRAIYFLDTYANNIRGSATIANDVISASGAASWSSYGTTTGSTQTLFKYDLRPEKSSLVVNLLDAASGSVAFEQVLTLVLEKQTAADSYEFRLMAQGRAQAFVEDSNGNCFLLGVDHGLNVTSHGSETGTAISDMSGHNITLTGREKEGKLWLAASAGEGTAKFPFDGLSDEADITIVSGT